MTDQELKKIFAQVHRSFPNNHILTLDAVFYPYKTVRNTIRLCGGHLSIQVSDRLRPAPVYIIEIAAHLLFSKLYDKRPEKRLRQVYNAYCTNLVPVKINPPKGYTSSGKYYDLKERFDYVNKNFFNSGLRVNNIGWSKKTSYTRLGFYDHKRDLLVISSVFDDRSVPSEVVDYLLYHEMLHIKFPVISKNGRRIIHSPAFRNAEKEFPDYTQVKNWIDKYLRNRRKRFRSF